MQLKGKSVRSISKFTPIINDGRSFFIGVTVAGNEDRLQIIGFPKNIEAGLSILPSEIGKCTKFNSSGREVVRMDLPLVSETKMVWSTWNDWHGYSHSGIQRRNYKVRQKDLIAPPGEHITIFKTGNDLFAVSRELSVTNDSEDSILHVVNLFLECFGQCQLLDQNITQIIKVRRLNWVVLPKGEYPWDVAKEHVKKLTSRLLNGDREVVEYRIERITKNRPDFLAIGQGGFYGYFVFGFTKKELYVLESPSLGNATYIFKSNWKELSQLTKKEILTGSLHYRRIIHNRGWLNSLTNTLSGK